MPISCLSRFLVSNVLGELVVNAVQFGLLSSPSPLF
jgi:hypothetical protein